MSEQDKRMERIDAIVGDDEEHAGQMIGKYFEYLKANLQLPCEVTGIEDFQWEEMYVMTSMLANEYQMLKKTQPSFRDRYQLLDIQEQGRSPWMMFNGEDIAANVQRIGDGKKFVLGLSELEATVKGSPIEQLLRDYAVFFCNYR